MPIGWLFLLACKPVDTDVDEGVPAVAVLETVVPAEARVGDGVTLSGAGFLAAQGDGHVTVGGVTAAVTGWSEGSITIVVPDVFPGDTTVVVTNADAAFDDGGLSIVLPPALYVNLDVSPNYLTALAFDRTTSTFSTLGGSPHALGYDTTGFAGYGGESSSVHVNVASRRLFASGSGFLSVFDIDPVTGALAEVGLSPFGPDGDSHYGITTDPAGDVVYVADYAGLIYGYAVAPDGALTALSGSPYPSTDVDTLMLRADGAYLYANNESSGLDVYAVGSEGALARLAGMPFPTGSYAFGARLRPGHDQVFLPQTDGVGVFDVSGADGVPVAIAGSPFVPSDFQAAITNAIAFSPDGDRLWVGEFLGDRYWVFDVAPDGALTEVAGSPFLVTSPDQQTSLFAMSRDGAHLAMVSELIPTVGAFVVEASGQLTPVTGGQWQATGAPAWAASGVAGTF